MLHACRSNPEPGYPSHSIPDYVVATTLCMTSSVLRGVGVCVRVRVAAVGERGAGGVTSGGGVDAPAADAGELEGLLALDVVGG